jgi:hypothetical protein
MHIDNYIYIYTPSHPVFQKLPTLRPSPHRLYRTSVRRTEEKTCTDCIGILCSYRALALFLANQYANHFSRITANLLNTSTLANSGPAFTLVILLPTSTKSYALRLLQHTPSLKTTAATTRPHSTNTTHTSLGYDRRDDDSGHRRHIQLITYILKLPYCVATPNTHTNTCLV